MATGSASMKTSRRRRIGWVSLVAGALVAAAPRPAISENKKQNPPAARAKKGAPPVTVNVAALTEKLKGADPMDVQAALTEAKGAGKGARPLAPVIEELLQRGAGELAGLALQTLGEVGTETS